MGGGGVYACISVCGCVNVLERERARVCVYVSVRVPHAHV